MTVDVEVTNVSTHGFWLMLGAEELVVSFVDLAVESIRHPENFH